MPAFPSDFIFGFIILTFLIIARVLVACFWSLVAGLWLLDNRSSLDHIGNAHGFSGS